MTLRKCLQLLIITGVIFVASSSEGNGQDSSSSPYIFYYSNSLSAFVIERPDGSDSRILTQFALPEDTRSTNLIDGPGWSPSGRWFAWTIQSFYAGALGAQPATSVGNLTSHDGSSTISLITDSSGVTRFDMSWSPSEDLLLVRETHFPNNTDGSSVSSRTYVFSPDLQESVFEIQDASSLTRWTPDGEWIVTEYPLDQIMLIADLNGVVQTRETLGTVIGWSHDGRAIYQSNPETLIIEDFVTGKVQTLESPSNFVTNVYWSPDDQSALILFRESFDEEYGQLWLYSAIDDTLDLIHETVSFDMISFGSSRSPWSPDSIYFTFLSTNNRLYAAELDGISLQQVPIPADYNVHALDWSSNGRLSIFGDVNRLSDVLFTYDSETNTLDELYTIDTEISYSYFVTNSLSGRFVAFSTIESEEDYYVVDTLSNSVSARSHDESQNEPYGVDAMEWHPSEDWLVLHTPTDSISVANVDGTIHRDIGLCLRLHSSCFGWLPELNE